MTPPPIVELAADAEALARQVAHSVAARASSASERFDLCLSGGSTPKRVYELFGDKDLGASLDWQKVHFFSEWYAFGLDILGDHGMVAHRTKTVHP